MVSPANHAVRYRRFCGLSGAAAFPPYIPGPATTFLGVPA